MQRADRSLSVRLVALGLLVTTTSSSGCSLLFVQAPPPESERGPPQEIECTRSFVAPGVDLFFATLGLLRVVSAGTASAPSNPNQSDSRGTYMALGLGVFMVAGASSLIGFVRARECQHAQDGRAPLRRPPHASAADVLPLLSAPSVAAASHPRLQLRSSFETRRSYGVHLAFEAQ